MSLVLPAGVSPCILVYMADILAYMANHKLVLGQGRLLAWALYK